MDIYEIAKRVKSAFNELLTLFKGIIYQITDVFRIAETSNKKKTYPHLNYPWQTIKDTRKRSQVTINKPRFIVRKII